jgi:hypothetical protein
MNIMTQLIVLGGILAGFLALYMYASNNKEKYTRKNEPPNDPLNVIYLPADMQAQNDACANDSVSTDDVEAILEDDD